jgi:hypothetical protein
MADYRSEASFLAITNLTEDEITWLEEEFSVDFDELEDSQAWAEQREMPTVDTWGFSHTIIKHKVEGECLHIYNDDDFDVENAAGFLHYFIEKKRPKYVIGFDWANTCSKSRLDAFGGGAVVITKDEVVWLSTNCWLEEEMRNHK